MQQVAERERCRTQDGRLLLRRVEVEDADVGLVEVRCPRRPDVRRDAVLVGKPEQRSRVSDQWMAHRPALLRNLDALQPLGKTLRDILLKEAFLANTAVVALHRDGTAADMRHHEW